MGRFINLLYSDSSDQQYLVISYLYQRVFIFVHALILLMDNYGSSLSILNLSQLCLSLYL